MKKVINGKVYDTEKAKLVHEWNNGNMPGDFKYREKKLYRTKKGNWFLHHVGGAMTDMAKPVGNNNTSGSESIETISEEDAIGFLESHGGDEVILNYFPERVEEA